MILSRASFKQTKFTASQVQVAKTPLATFESNVSGLYIPEILAYIQATQAGTGDPSPSNPRAITGVSSVDATVCGVNLIDPNLLLDQVGWNIITFNLSPNTQYTMSTNCSQDKGSELALYFFSSSGHPDSGSSVYSGHPITITTDSDGIAKIQQRRVRGTDSFQNYQWQLQTGNYATAYHAYTGTTATTDLGGTYYGGYVNVPTGLLTVTDVTEDMGNLKWYRTTSYTNPIFYASITGKQPIDTGFMCEKYKYLGSFSNASSFSSSENYTCGDSTINTQIYVRNDDYSDTNSFKTAMTGTLIKYRLATPQTVQLTPAQIEQLLGQNNVFCSTGDVEVDYWHIN